MALPVLYWLLCAVMVVTVNGSVMKRDTWSPREDGSGRIVNGYQAGVGQFPHQALVMCGSIDVFGGSLITSTAVLTAAYCIDNFSPYTVRLGGIHRTEEESTAWIVVSRWGEIHPDYNSSGHLNYNVGVVFLPEEAPLNRFINVVALPSFLEVNDTYTGQSAVVSGWGISNDGTCCPEILLWTEVTVVSNSVCAEFVEPGFVDESTLCAGNQLSGSCNGDHGSALVLETAGGYKQIGVASFNRNYYCSTEGEPGGFTRVTAVLDWIVATASVDLH